MNHFYRRLIHLSALKRNFHYFSHRKLVSSNKSKKLSNRKYPLSKRLWSRQSSQATRLSLKCAYMSVVDNKNFVSLVYYASVKRESILLRDTRVRCRVKTISILLLFVSRVHSYPVFCVMFVSVHRPQSINLNK